MYVLMKRTINNEYGQEIILEKRHKLSKDRWKDRLWVLQPQDPRFIAIDTEMKKKGLWT